MIEKIEWIFDNLQRLQGVPVNETNVAILFGTHIRLRDVYNELKGGADSAEESARATTNFE